MLFAVGFTGLYISFSEKKFGLLKIGNEIISLFWHLIRGRDGDGLQTHICCR